MKILALECHICRGSSQENYIGITQAWYLTVQYLILSPVPFVPYRTSNVPYFGHQCNLRFYNIAEMQDIAST